MTAQAYVNNDYLPAVSLSNYKSAPENGWIRVNIPASDLGVQTNDWFRSLRLNAGPSGAGSAARVVLDRERGPHDVLKARVEAC